MFIKTNMKTATNCHFWFVMFNGIMHRGTARLGTASYPRPILFLFHFNSLCMRRLNATLQSTILEKESKKNHNNFVGKKCLISQPHAEE